MRKVLWFCLLGVGSLFAAPRVNLAVLEFTPGGGVDSQAVQSVSARLEAELVGTEAFAVVERKQMDLILQEQGFQQSGACSSTGCEVQIGQVLGVDRLVTGSLGKVGDVFTLNVKVLNVTTGAVESSHVVDVVGDLSLALTEGCEQLAEDISSGKSTSTKRRIVSHKAWWIGGVAVLAVIGGVGAWWALQDEPEGEVVDRTRYIGGN